MEGRSLVPLVKGVCNITGKTADAVKATVEDDKRRNHRGIFGPPKEALAEARRIADQNAPIQCGVIIQQEDEELDR